jgi:hypothetical protein
MHEEPSPPEGDGALIDQELLGNPAVLNALRGPEHDPGSERELVGGLRIRTNTVELTAFDVGQMEFGGDSHGRGDKASSI